MMNSIVEQFNSVLTGCSLKATPAPSKNDAPINLGTEEYESRARVLARRAEKLRQAAAESEQLAREFKLQAQQSTLKKSSRAKMPIPHNCGLFAYFSSVNFSGSLYISIMGVLLPALATYLSPEDSLNCLTRLMSLYNVTIFTVPFFCSLAETIGDVKFLIQFCSFLSVSGTFLFVATLAFKSISLAYVCVTFIGISTMQTTAGNLFVLTTVYSISAPKKAGATSAVLQLAFATSSVFSLVLLYFFPLFKYSKGESWSSELVMSPSYTSLSSILFISLIAWIGVLNAPPAWTVLKNFISVQPSSSSICTPLAQTCKGLASILCRSEYRGLLVASVMNGLFTGIINGSNSVILFFAEDSGALPASEVLKNLPLCGAFGALSTLITTSLLGLLIDAFGPLSGLYLISFAYAGSLACLCFLDATPVLIYASLTIAPHLIILYNVAIIPYVALNLLPSLESIARDGGFFNSLTGIIVSVFIFLSGPFLNSFGTTTSNTNAQGRVRYSDDGYFAFFFVSACSVAVTPVILHLSKQCTTPSSTGRFNLV